MTQEKPAQTPNYERSLAALLRSANEVLDQVTNENAVYGGYVVKVDVMGRLQSAMDDCNRAAKGA